MDEKTLAELERWIIAHEEYPPFSPERMGSLMSLGSSMIQQGPALIAAARERNRLAERVKELEEAAQYTRDKLARAEAKIGELITESGNGENADFWDRHGDNH